jgi:4-hydroxy-3-methylbut-2-enyl diphosphate reductase LytB-like protein
MKKILATLMKITLAKHDVLDHVEQSVQGGHGPGLSRMVQNPITKSEFATFDALESLPDAPYVETAPAMISAYGAPERAIPVWRHTGGAAVSRAHASSGRFHEVLSESDEPAGQTTAFGKSDQEALSALLSEADAVVVVGRNNKNTERVLNSCRKAGTPSFHVERLEELSPSWFKSFETVGVVAATLTWLEAIEAARIWLQVKLGRKR